MKRLFFILLTLSLCCTMGPAAWADSWDLKVTENNQEEFKVSLQAKIENGGVLDTLGFINQNTAYYLDGDYGFNYRNYVHMGNIINTSGDVKDVDFYLYFVDMNGFSAMTGVMESSLGDYALTIKDESGGTAEQYHLFLGEQINIPTVPEPATLLLFGMGALGIAGISRKKLTG